MSISFHAKAIVTLIIFVVNEKHLYCMQLQKAMQIPEAFADSSAMASDFRNSREGWRGWATSTELGLLLIFTIIYPEVVDLLGLGDWFIL